MLANVHEQRRFPKTETWAKMMCCRKDHNRWMHSLPGISLTFNSFSDLMSGSCVVLRIKFNKLIEMYVLMCRRRASFHSREIDPEFFLHAAWSWCGYQSYIMHFSVWPILPHCQNNISFCVQMTLNLIDWPFLTKSRSAVVHWYLSILHKKPIFMTTTTICQKKSSAWKSKHNVLENNPWVCYLGN